MRSWGGEAVGMAQRPGDVKLCTEAPKGMCDMLKRVTLRGKSSLPGSEIDRGDAFLAIGECFSVS